MPPALHYNKNTTGHQWPTDQQLAEPNTTNVYPLVLSL